MVVIDESRECRSNGWFRSRDVKTKVRLHH